MTRYILRYPEIIVAVHPFKILRNGFDCDVVAAHLKWQYHQPSNVMIIPHKVWFKNDLWNSYLFKLKVIMIRMREVGLDWFILTFPPHLKLAMFLGWGLKDSLYINMHACLSHCHVFGFNLRRKYGGLLMMHRLLYYPKPRTTSQLQCSNVLDYAMLQSVTLPLKSVGFWVLLCWWTANSGWRTKGMERVGVGSRVANRYGRRTEPWRRWPLQVRGSFICATQCIQQCYHVMLHMDT